MLFLQGGASTQFAMVPMNFIPPGGSADYVDTGTWSTKALKEAKIIANGRVAATSEPDGFTRIPRRDEYDLDPTAAYVHITSNNTIKGTQYHEFPDVGDTPLVADMSSDFLWRPFDANRFSLIYAGAQKNIGPSGVTIVIVKKSWIENANENIPTMLRYATHSAKDSLYNTPPTFAIYMVRNVLEWVKDQGGLAAMEQTKPRQGRSALQRHRRSSGLLPLPGRTREPVVHERRLASAVGGARGQVRRRGARGRDVRAQGPPLGGRLPRVDLQRHAHRRRRVPGRFHDAIRRRESLIPRRAAPLADRSQPPARAGGSFFRGQRQQQRPESASAPATGTAAGFGVRGSGTPRRSVIQSCRRVVYGPRPIRRESP